MKTIAKGNIPSYLPLSGEELCQASENRLLLVDYQHNLDLSVT